MKKNVEIISLIYKSKDYLHLIYNQLKSDYCKANEWDVGIRILLNDATDEIKEEVKKLDINHTIFENPDKNEYYLNRVYKAWNHCAVSSEYDNVCFVNSDMLFSPNWLSNLLKHHNGIHIPTSRLIESGKLNTAPGRYGIVRNFGKTCNNINYPAFLDFARQVSENKVIPSGLFMPVIFEKQRFIDNGMYPEGNVYTTGIGKFGDPFVMSGDLYYFNRLENEYGMRHITVFDSIVYHIQEGEKDTN